MPRAAFKFLSPLFLLPCLSAAQDCSHYWQYTLDTDPTHPKGYSGDTNNGYGLFAVQADNTTKFVVKGQFPQARFISLQTYQTRFQKNIDDIIDVDIEPDPGSENPFRAGVPLNTARRAFMLELVPPQFYTGKTNQLKLPGGHLNQNFFYRIYSPNAGVTLTPNDLPKVYAYDASTNEPVSCPKPAAMSPYLAFPEFFASIVSLVTPFEFKERSGVIGSNAGVPSYLYAIKRMSRHEVAVVHFKAPSFVNTRSSEGRFLDDGEVRYWSFCLQDFPHNITLACLPDYLSKPDASDRVTLVVGSGAAVQEAALSRGFNFLEDTRAWNQRVMGFVYRNVLPKTDFEPKMYQGDYLPEASICTDKDFIIGQCP